MPILTVQRRGRIKRWCAPLVFVKWSDAGCIQVPNGKASLQIVLNSRNRSLAIKIVQFAGILFVRVEFALAAWT